MTIEEQDVNTMEDEADLTQPGAEFEAEDGFEKNDDEQINRVEMTRMLSLKSEASECLRRKINDLQLWLARENAPEENASIEFDEKTAEIFLAELSQRLFIINSLPATECLVPANQLIAEIDDVLDFFRGQEEDSQVELSRSESKIGTLNSEISQIEKKNSLMRTLLFLKNKNLRQQKTEILSDNKKKYRDIQDAKKKLIELYDKKSNLESFRNEVTKAAKNEQFASFDREVGLELTQLKSEICNNQPFIIDSIRASIKTRLLGGEYYLFTQARDSNERMKAMNELLSKIIISFDEQSGLVLELKDFDPAICGFPPNNSQSFFDHFTNFANIINNNSSSICASARNCRENASDRLANQMILNETSKLDDAILQMFPHGSLYAQISREKEVGIGYSGKRYKEWLNISNSKEINVVFGDEIKSINNEINADLLIKSLSDLNGEYIDLLEFFPSPKSIRNLILLSYADNKSYRQQNARETLQKIVKSDKWPSLKVEIEKIYPSMNWEYIEVEINKEYIAGQGLSRDQKVNSFAGEVYVKSLDNQGRQSPLSILALETMSLSGLTDVAVEKNLLSREQAILLDKANSIVEKTSYNKKIGSGFIREQLIESLVDGPRDVLTSKELLAKLVLYVKSVIKYRDHDEVVQGYLEGSNVANSLKNKNISAGNLLLDAPGMLGDFSNNLRYLPGKQFFGAFAGEKTIDDYRKILVAFREFPEKLQASLGFIENEIMSEEWAAELPSIAGNIFKSDKFWSLAYNWPCITLTSKQAVLQYNYFINSYENIDTDKCNAVLRLVSQGVLSMESASRLPNIPFLNSDEAWKLACDYPKLLITDFDAVVFGTQFFSAYDSTVAGFVNLKREILNLVSDEYITKERALELANVSEFQAIENSEQHYFPDEYKNFPQLSLTNDIGLRFTGVKNKKGLGTINPEIDIEFGRVMSTVKNSLDVKNGRGNEYVDNYVARMFVQEINSFKGEILNIEKENWLSRLMVFTSTTLEGYRLPKLTSNDEDKIKELFGKSEAKDLCMEELQKMWQSYLQSGDSEKIPAILQIVASFVDQYGAGPMSQFEALGGFIHSCINQENNSKVATKTKQANYEGMAIFEKRLAKGWDNEAKTDFYNIAKGIMDISPALFSDYLKLFEVLSVAEFKNFSNELLPLYQAKMVLLDKKASDGKRKQYPRQLVDIRKDLQALASKYLNKTGQEGEVASEKKTEITAEITSLFKNHFGIIKIPEQFSPEVIRSLINSSKYLANLNAKTQEKENILGFYLAMIINGQWQAFRKNETIAPDELLTQEKSEKIKKFLDDRQSKNIVTSSSLSIDDSDLPGFISELQRESQNQALGEVETIDIKMKNVISNISDLADPDLYHEEIDKQRLNLQLKYGNKKIGNCIRKMCLQLLKPEISQEFIDEEVQIAGEIEEVIKKLDLYQGTDKRLSKLEVLNKYFQAGMKSFEKVYAISDYLKEVGASEQIELLEKVKSPGAEVAIIFNKLGENFQPTSGAVALSQDIDYLENLLNKNKELQSSEKQKLSNEEMSKAQDYIEKVRLQLFKLQEIYKEIEEKSSSLVQVSKSTHNELLKAKLLEIKSIIDRPDKQQMIFSTLTNNLDTIMENIRECLSCVRQGCNNDTNLTFGDNNKFLVISQTDLKQKGSIADQIVYFEPIVRADGSDGMAFVLDRVYGTRTPSILINHIETVYKKYQNLKQSFPGAKMSIVIPENAMSGIVNSKTLIASLEDKFGGHIECAEESISINLAPSAAGDHYQEFSPHARTAGIRGANSVIVTV